MKIKNIIWDFDGTIMDTYPAIVTATLRLAQKNNVKVSYDEVFAMTKITLRYALEFISAKCHKSYEKLFEEYLLEYSNLDYSTLTLFPNVKQVLELIIQEGGKNYIVTHRKADSLNEHLDTNNIKHLFTYIISGDCDFARKPSPQAFLYLRDKFNLSAQDTIVVGDRLLDLQAGYGAGFKGILYRNRSDFAGKITSIDDYSQLISLIVA